MSNLTVTDRLRSPAWATRLKATTEAADRLDEIEAGIKVIAPWLSASLTEHEHDGAGDYLKACNEIFRLDRNG